MKPTTHPHIVQRLICGGIHQTPPPICHHGVDWLTFLPCNLTQLLLACQGSTPGFSTSAFSCSQTQIAACFGTFLHHEKSCLLFFITHGTPIYTNFSRQKWQFRTFIFYSCKLIFIDFNTYPCCAVMLGWSLKCLFISFLWCDTP